MLPCSATMGWWTVTSLVPSGKRAFDLDLVDHLGDAVGDVGAAEELPAEIHQLGHRAAVADELEDLRRDERDRFRMIQPDPARQAFLREEAGLMQEQFVDLARRQMHASPFARPRIIAEERRHEGQIVSQNAGDVLHGSAGDANDAAHVGEGRHRQEQVGAAFKWDRRDPRKYFIDRAAHRRADDRRGADDVESPHPGPQIAVPGVERQGVEQHQAPVDADRQRGCRSA